MEEPKNLLTEFEEIKKKLSYLVYDLLESFPEDARMKFSQLGLQEIGKSGEQTIEEIKKLVKEDIKAFGRKVDTEGKFVIFRNIGRVSNEGDCIWGYWHQTFC